MGDVDSRAAFLGSKVAYEIYIRSFNDANGDGVGDLRGITQRLDHLADLGVDYLWITPFFVSPLNDGGYDVADYRNIDPIFGTMDDFAELVREADARGMGIMLDMVFNHTSDQHEWFQRALAGDPKYQAYYLFRDAEPGATADKAGRPPTNWESKFGGSAWAYVPELNKWYLHLYDVSQPDLDWRNPEVRAELARVLRFWKDRGVRGFRFDVVNNISKPVTLEDDHEGDGRRFYTDGTHVDEYLRELVAEGGIDGMMTVGEMSSTTIDHCIEYSKPENHELAMTFSFHQFRVDNDEHGSRWSLTKPNIALLRDTLRDWQERMAAGGGWNALFWSNHDQPRPVSRFGDDSTPESWRRSAELLATCTHLMRGTPYIYQGEELGMTNPDFTSIDQYRDVETRNYYKILQHEGKSAAEAFAIMSYKSRDDSRTPVQWDASEHAGFTTGTPWIAVSGNHTWLNAAAERVDPDSVYHYFRRLIRLRKAERVIQAGDVRFIDASSDSVIAYERTLNNERVLVLCNFSADEQPAVDAAALVGATVLVSNCGDNATTTGTLAPWEATAYVWRT